MATMSFPNGQWPASALRRIPGGRLAPLPAAAWNAMCARARRLGRRVPMPNGPLSTYRALAGQWLMRRQWCARGQCQNAAVPGTSRHGNAEAVDSNDRETIHELGPPFGWGIYSDAPWESWHNTFRDVGWRPPRDPLEPDERRACDELQRLRRRRPKGLKTRRRIRHLSEWLLRRADKLARRAKQDGWKRFRRGQRYQVITGVLGDDAVRRMRRRPRLRRRKK